MLNRNKELKLKATGRDFDTSGILVINKITFAYWAETKLYPKPPLKSFGFYTLLNNKPITIDLFSDSYFAKYSDIINKGFVILKSVKYNKADSR